jgi:Protein of unknown function (DUF3592)
MNQSTQTNKYEQLFEVLGKVVPWLLIFILTTTVATISIGDCYKSISAANWPSVVGKIENISWHEGRFNKKRQYKVIVSYDYSIGDREYHNDTLAIGYSGSDDRKNNQLILDKLQNATEVSVRYNPDLPEQSTLAYGLNAANVFTLLGFLGSSVLSMLS